MFSIQEKVDQGMRRKHAGRIALPCGGGGKKCVWNSYTRVRWCVPLVPSTLCGFPASAQGRSRFTWATMRMTLDVSYYGPPLNGGAVDFGLLADISGKVCQ